MKRIVYILVLVIVLAAIGGLPVSLALGEVDNGSHSTTVTVSATPSYGVTDVSDYVDENGVFTQGVAVESPDGMCQLTIPEGTTGLTKEGEPLSWIRTIPMEDPPPPPKDYNVIGLVYDLGPEGTTFVPPIALTFTYDESLIPEGVAEEDLVIATWDAASEQWVKLEGCVVDPVANTITGPVSHFSEFSTLAYTPPTPPTPPSPSGGGGGGGGPRVSILTVDTLGSTVAMRITSDGILLESYIADPGGDVILWLESGTEIICSDDQVPKRLEVSLSEESPPAPEGFALVSPVYDLTAYTSDGVPRPVTFDSPITLQVNYSPEEVPENVSSLFVAYHDEEEGWTQLEPPSSFIAEVGTAGAQVSHFTPFVVMADLPAPPLPARFEVHNLDINPIQVTAGESVTISAQLVNIGGLRGEHNLIVNIEGLLETSHVIRLTPGETQVITFTVTPVSLGSYRVEIGDAQGNFEVRTILAPPIPTPPIPAPPAPAAEPGGYGWLIAIISAVAAMAALALIARRKRLQPAPAVEPGIYRWLLPKISAVTAIAASAFTAVRERLQRAAGVEKPAKPVPGDFRISNLKITPRRVKPDGSVTIISEAANTGLVTGSYSLVLKIKGIVEAVKEITLAPGQSQKVAFTILKDKPGVYDVDLEGLKDSFTVEEVAAPPDSPLSSGG